MDKTDLTETTAKKKSRFDVHRAYLISQLQKNIAEISNWTEKEFLEFDRDLEDIEYWEHSLPSLDRLFEGIEPLFSCKMCAERHESIPEKIACEDDMAAETCLMWWSEYANKEIED